MPNVAKRAKCWQGNQILAKKSNAAKMSNVAKCKMLPKKSNVAKQPNLAK